MQTLNWKSSLSPSPQSSGNPSKLGQKGCRSQRVKWKSGENVPLNQLSRYFWANIDWNIKHWAFSTRSFENILWLLACYICGTSNCGIRFVTLSFSCSWDSSATGHLLWSSCYGLCSVLLYIILSCLVVGDLYIFGRWMGGKSVLCPSYLLEEMTIFNFLVRWQINKYSYINL